MGKLVAFILPVDAPTGNFWHTFEDLRIPGRGPPLDLSRTYNSMAATTGGPFGRGWSFSYAMKLEFPDLQHVTVNQENGTQVTFTKQSNGTFSAPPRVTATLEQVGSGWRFVRRARSSFAFDSAGKLIAETDLNGYVTSLAYDAQDQLSTVTDSAGRTLSFAYTGSRITSVTDPAGRVVRYGYDSAGDLIDVTDVGGGDTHFTYDAAAQMLTMRMPNQGTISNVYDAQGRVTSQSDQLGRTTTFAYSGDSTSQAGGATAITDPNGHITVQAYEFNELVGQTNGFGTPQAATWKFGYDPATLGMTTVTDPNGHTTTSTFDARGNVLTSTDAMGGSTTHTYDALNDLSTTTDSRGVTTTMTYDAHGNLLTRSRPLLGSGRTQVTRYVYGDPQHPGDVTAMIDPIGATWRYAYDGYGYQASTADPLGDKTQSIYNVLGWLTARISARGYRTTYTYNAFGDRTTTTDPLGHTTASAYDRDRNLVAARDASGRLTHYIYDGADEKVAVVRANGTTFRTTFDGAGNFTQQIDPLRHVTTYTYDPLNRVASTTDPLGRQTTYAYDGVGNRLSLTDPKRQTTTYGYDAANELTSIRYSDRRTPAVKVTYNAEGDRTAMTDGTGRSRYTYDSLDRITKTTDGHGTSVGYAYDLRGDVTTVTYPGHRTLTKSYDAAGRLIATRDWLGHIARLSYDSDADIVAEALPGHAADRFDFDRADRLVGIRDRIGRTSEAAFSYRRDRSGLLTDERSRAARAARVLHNRYQYTALGQLGRVNRRSLRYDAADNLTLGESGSRQAYDQATELTRAVSSSRGRRVAAAFRYDARGNRTRQVVGRRMRSSLYRYDQASRLIAFGKHASYSYNGDGLRTQKIVGRRRTNFVWDVSGALPQLLADGKHFYVYGPDQLPVEQTGPRSKVLFYHHDQLGSTRLLTDLKGRVVATFAFTPYGRLASTPSTPSTPLLFAGQYRDSESALYYLRARYYDTSTAQFLTVDPAVRTTHSPYAYVDGNPLARTDPGGLDENCSIFAFWAPDNCAREALATAHSPTWQQLEQNREDLKNTAIGQVIRFDPLVSAVEDVNARGQGASDVSNADLIWDAVGVASLGGGVGAKALGEAGSAALDTSRALSWWRSPLAKGGYWIRGQLLNGVAWELGGLSRIAGWASNVEWFYSSTNVEARGCG